MADTLVLIAVATGEVYERYAEGLFASADEHLRPGFHVKTVMLPGVPGWPAATLYRYHVILEHEPELDGHWLFLCDADMRCEEDVGGEILEHLVATLHPGYVGRHRDELPYETRPESQAYVPPDRGRAYYAGGFVGGTREVFLALARRMVVQIDDDDEQGIMARWHDESHLNSILAETPPTLALSPAYCHPDDDRSYLPTWPEPYPRKLVALDKSPAERGVR